MTKAKLHSVWLLKMQFLNLQFRANDPVSPLHIESKQALQIFTTDTVCKRLTLTISSPITIVKDESIVVETSLFLKSMDTKGKSETAR